MIKYVCGFGPFRFSIKAVSVQFTRNVAMKEALSPSNAESALQADITND